MDVFTGKSIGDRVRGILSNIRAAADKSGRDPHRVRLVAATKTVSVEHIREGMDAGLSILGENRLQEALPKIEALAQTQARWHFIGQLQRRKVRSVIGRFELVHSVDSVELASEIDRRAGEIGIVQDVLLEVNVGGESTKAGFRPEGLVEMVTIMARLTHLRIKGLMAIPPPTVEAESARPYFVQIRELARAVNGEGIPGIMMDELSMGMSNDYSVAVEEGATLVRVGSAIFGARHV